MCLYLFILSKDTKKLETNNKDDIKTKFEETGRQNKKENNKEDGTNNNIIENLTEE